MQLKYASAGVSKDISAIPALTRSDLINRWTTVNGRPPPKGISRRLLEYNAAYQVQIEAHGGLSSAQRNKLRRLAAINKGRVPNSTRKATTSKLPPPGSRLVREWHGKTYTVEVLDKGFLCDEQHYRSLSEVARTITGARWSGPRFFGL